MNVRPVQVILTAEDHARYRAAAAAEGVSLTDWLRAAAEHRLSAGEPLLPLTLEDLDEFFASCDRVELGIEPDWEDHLAAISQARRLG